MKKRTEKMIGMLLAVMMLWSCLPVQAFAAGLSAGTEDTPVVADTVQDVRAGSVLDQITPEKFFELIKGDNASMDQITGNLIDLGETVEKYGAGEKMGLLVADGQLSFTENRGDAYCKWVSSSQPDYLDVEKNPRGLDLRKRPAPGEAPQEVTLTLAIWSPDEAERTLALNLKVLPGEAIPTDYSIIQDKLFETIKGTNADAQHVTDAMTIKNLSEANGVLTAYLQLGRDNVLKFGSKYYPKPNYMLTFGASSNEAAASISTEGIVVKRQAEDAEVRIPVQAYRYYASSNQVLLGNFDLTFTVLAAEGTVSGIFDQLTEDMLFTAIQGQNVSRDAIDQDFELQANGYNPLFIKAIKEDGIITWWSRQNGTIAKVHIAKSSAPEIIEVGEDKVLLKSRPEKDTPVELTYTVTDLATGVIQDMPVHLIVKGTGTSAQDLITPVKEGLITAILGDNADGEKIKSDLKFPGACNPFYASVEGQKVVWDGAKTETSNVEIRLIETDHPELMQVEAGGIRVTGRPDSNTVVTLKAALTDLTRAEAKPEEASFQVTMTAATAVEKELTGYLEKYLKPENYQYTTIEKEGVDFQKDFSEGKVRYSMKLPNITAAENIPFGEIKTSVTAKDTAVIKKVNNYVWEPIRADVGQEARTAILTYTLTKNGESVSKEITLGIPALTQPEIDEEIQLLEKIQKNFFQGIKGKNYDQNNVSDSLVNLSEIRMEGGQVVWSEGAKENKYHGFKFSTGTQYGSWEVNYESGYGDIFDPTNMVLQHRPKEDTRVQAGHMIESVQLQKYAELYPDNASLQKIKRQMVYTDLIVKKVNPNLKTIVFGAQRVPVQEGQKSYAWLTEQTEARMVIEAVPENMSALMVINGEDCSQTHQQEILLDQGFARFGINVSDRDNKNAGTEQNRDYTVTIVSREALEQGAAALPEDPSNATLEEAARGQALYDQWSALSEKDQAKINGAEKLKKYGKEGGLEQAARAQLEQAAAQLFEGIRGENASRDAVWTDLKEVHYARVGAEGVQFFEKPEAGCNVRIKWTASSAPEYVDIHNGNDFETGYVNAFLLRKRPAREGSDLQVTFKAELTQMTEAVSQEAGTDFTLKAYNARLSELKADEFDLAFDPEIANYTLFNIQGQPQLTLTAKPVIPGAVITIGGEKVTEGMTIALDQEVTIVEMKVSDGVRNTLNEKWDERIYKITVLSSVAALEAEIQKLPEPDAVTEENYQSLILTVDNLKKAYDGLNDDQKDQISETAKTKLQGVSDKIEALKLEALKASARTEISVYGGNEEDYTPRNWQKVLAAREKALKDIEEAQQESAVIEALTVGKAAITAVPKKDTGEAAVNTALEGIWVMPGAVKVTADAEGVYRVKMPADIQAVTVKVLPENKKALAQVNGEEIMPENDWTSKQTIALEGEKAVEVTVTIISSDESVKKDYRLIVEREEKIPDQQIDVSFELIGDQKHGEGQHTAFEVWIENTTIKVPENATVKYLTDKLLMEYQIPFETAGGSYIRAINGLAEMDNGPRSGWVYLVNGQKAGTTYDSYILQPGDQVVWRYTDDYLADGFFHDDEEAADTIRKMIQALPNKEQLTLNDKEQVQRVLNAYDQLSDGAKALITEADLSRLQEAVDQIAVLEKAAADQAKAQPVIDQIAALGEITDLKQKAVVEAARAAFAALTKDQQAYVTNLDLLKAAEAKIAALEKAEQPLPPTGDSHSPENQQPQTPSKSGQDVKTATNVGTGLTTPSAAVSGLAVLAVLAALGVAMVLRNRKKNGQ